MQTFVVLRCKLSFVPYDLNVISLATYPVSVVALETSQLHQKDHHVTVAQDAKQKVLM